MSQVCRAANLQQILRHDTIQLVMGKVIDAYTKIVNGDPRGTRIRDAFTLREANKEVGIPSVPYVMKALDDATFISLLNYLNQRSGSKLYVDENVLSRPWGSLCLHRMTTECNLIKIGGVSFRPG